MVRFDHPGPLWRSHRIPGDHLSIVEFDLSGHRSSSSGEPAPIVTRSRPAGPADPTRQAGGGAGSREEIAAVLIQLMAWAFINRAVNRRRRIVGF